jgi:hypothetical protein
VSRAYQSGSAFFGTIRMKFPSSRSQLFAQHFSVPRHRRVDAGKESEGKRGRSPVPYRDKQVNR